MKIYNQITATLLSGVIMAVSCKQQALDKKEPKVSDMLENALSAVVTIKIEATSGGKTAFGFASEEKTAQTTADIAYSEMLKLDNAKGTGSGFVIKHKGVRYIVTNAHVIEMAGNLDKDLVAYSFSRKEHRLKIVGGDSFYDIAVLQFVEAPDSTITDIPFSGSESRIGQKVYAIGNPLGFFPYSVTEGIISAKNRPGLVAKSGYLQSSAIISPGSSGGPLINQEGGLVGVNSLGSEKAQQLNFALESQILEKIVTDIIEKGKIIRAYFGIEVTQFYKYSVDKDDNVVSKLLNEKPKLLKIIPNSPAANSLQDYLGYNFAKANNREINTNDDLLGFLETLKPKDTLFLTFEKEGLLEKKYIIADELTNDKLAEIAEFYFREHYNISLSRNEDGVFLNYPKGYQNNTFQWYDDYYEKFRNYVPRGERTYILACGNTTDIKELDLWRVKSYKDLGNALRLSAINGQISFLEYDGRRPYIVRVLISDRKDIISKTILY